MWKDDIAEGTYASASWAVCELQDATLVELAVVRYGADPNRLVYPAAGKGIEGFDAWSLVGMAAWHGLADRVTQLLALGGDPNAPAARLRQLPIVHTPLRLALDGALSTDRRGTCPAATMLCLLDHGAQAASTTAPPQQPRAAAALLLERTADRYGCPSHASLACAQPVIDRLARQVLLLPSDDTAASAAVVARAVRAAMNFALWRLPNPMPTMALLARAVPPRKGPCYHPLVRCVAALAAGRYYHHPRRARSSSSSGEQEGEGEGEGEGAAGDDDDDAAVVPPAVDCAARFLARGEDADPALRSALARAGRMIASSSSSLSSSCSSSSSSYWDDGEQARTTPRVWDARRRLLERILVCAGLLRRPAGVPGGGGEGGEAGEDAKSADSLALRGAGLAKEALDDGSNDPTDDPATTTEQHRAAAATAAAPVAVAEMPGGTLLQGEDGESGRADRPPRGVGPMADPCLADLKEDIYWED
ncbi:a1345e4d-bbc2-4194-816c-506e289d89f3 [Thermothielavioides terrestris]|nr:a1345e4d-bbc2-4194-816c-506e289d89f3 [Thermothielavioides terrestris]